MADLEPVIEPGAAAEPEERPLLNADLDFVRSLPQSLRSTFEGMPAKVLLREGEIIYRFLEQGFSGPAEGFWLPAETYHRLRKESLLDGIPLPDWAVTQSTTLPRKPHPTLFLQATLLEHVFAFRGPIKLPAGPPHLRLLIPGLTADRIVVRTFNL
ncbi:MAG: hypothetical protein J0H49_33915 [Acidobacteria bacterium]|nr:hypothetical protein [Acidobacteriota bacterium]